MKAKYLIIIITLGFFSSGAFAQDKKVSQTPAISQFVGLSWEIAVPTGDKKYLSQTSLGGARFEYRKFVDEQFSVGLAISFNGEEQLYGTNTYQKPDGSMAVTTDMVRQSFTMPITVIGHYYPISNSPIFRPYVGLGLGAEYATQDVFYNIYVIDNDNWGFVARPEIGTLVHLSEGFTGIASVGYNYATNKIDALGGLEFNQISFNIGVALSMH